MNVRRRLGERIRRRFPDARRDGEAGPHDPGPVRPGRTREDWRLVLVVLTMVLVYGAVGLRMGLLALTEPVEPRMAGGAGVTTPLRGEITDRNGNLLAANLPAFSLYADPGAIKDPAAVAADLAAIFPDDDYERLLKRLSRKARFAWIKRPITPRQRQAVLDLGYPGLKFGSRVMRIYPAGRTAAHLVGGVKAASEDVRFAELAGSGGVEGYFDARLRDPAQIGTPLELSIDLTVQAALRDVLAAGMKRFSAKGATAILMDVKTGELHAMVSLPDFDPNLKPKPYNGPAELNPRFNRAAFGRYELGSTFKVLTAASALESGIVGPQTMIETGSALTLGRYRIRDTHKLPPEMTLTDVVVRSSNVGSARLALNLGTERLKDYLNRLGMFEPLPLELAEAAQAKPLLPPRWTDLSTMTISFGHGLAVSPIHLAAGFATLANEGRRVRPTLIKGGREPGEQIFSVATSRAMLQIMREVVRRGTAQRGRVPGYDVGGKTGTADKFRPGGGYYDDRVISTFAAVFPIAEPRFALVVSLDEPVDRSGKYVRREASRTAVPVAAASIERIAPLLGLRPRPGSLPGALAAVQTSGQ